MLQVPLQLWLVRQPQRKLVIVSSDWALLFLRQPRSNNATQSDSGEDESVVIELIPRQDVDLEQATLLHSRVSGCLGVLAIGGDVFLPVITHATQLGSAYSRKLSGIGAEPINRILSVDFFCLSSSAFDYLHAPIPTAADAYGNGSHQSSTESFEISPSTSSSNLSSASRAELSAPPPTALEHPCQAIRKILANSNFYFSSGPDAFDLSTRLQARLEKAAERQAGDPGSTDGIDHDGRFLWNTYLVGPLLSFRTSLSPDMRSIFDEQGFMVLAIQGYVGTYDINIGGEPVVLSLISRLGWKRSGTRFNVRGVDDDGSVANFVETETILRTRDLCFSYVQTRGSVPLFWEEGGSQPFNQKITITRPIEASLPAFLRHCEDLLEHYSRFHILNLLANKEGEAALTQAYEAHLRAAQDADENVRDNVGMTEFDFHARSKGGGGIDSVQAQLWREVESTEETIGACVVGVDQGGDATQIMSQNGVFRTNCKGTSAARALQCLDRTNAVEDSLSRFALEGFLRNTRPEWLGVMESATLCASHRTLWADNGDALSKIYVGTGAINTSFTRTGKKSLAGLLSDASKSVNRVFQQQLFDSGKQKAIDALLGNLATSRRVRIYNPIHESLRSQLREREHEFTTYDTETIWVGTYNLNGRPPSDESLLPWLFPSAGEGPDPSLLVLGFQEIVPLSPQQIMATDPEKKRRWEQHILSTVANRPDKKSDYVLLRSGQLVGTALIVLCKKEVAAEVRNVEAAMKKTGVRGLAGNKGAVAIRLDYRATSFCFLTAHLAAGHSNVSEREQDYATIADGLHFSRGKTISNHENVIWAADTNFRISLLNDEVRGLAASDDYDRLWTADQLNTSMASGRSFAGYIEAPIVFRPTYKYDNGTDDYDTSDKMRIPAYTDRILYKGEGLDCYRYQRAELRTSDHRPGKSIAVRSDILMYALFRSRIRTVDSARWAALRKELLQQLLKHSPHESLDAKLSRVSINARGSDRTRLPPPSTDQQAWWNGKDGTFEPPPLPPRPRNRAVTNPFEPNFYADRASMASADSDRSSAASASPRAAPAPPPKPIRRGTAPPVEETPVGSLIDVSDTESSTSPPPTTTTPNPAFRAVKSKPPPAPPSRTGSSASQGLAASAHSEKVDRHDTGESWQMLT
ncbi:DNase I-like protein [Rhodotorula sp. JG-1b]|nr:DNase I-like protein [Rhodotorula sp. JG-1b]